MALPVITQIEIGGAPILEFTDLTITQSLFGHHDFSLGIPYDRIEGTKGTFLSKAHRQLCGQPCTITITTDVPGGEGGEAAQPSGRFEFQGLVTQLNVGNHGGDLTGAFQVEGYSPTYLLDQTPVRRSFRNKNLKTIFQEVLAPYAKGLLPLQAKPQYTATIPYVAQYDESAFTFLHRLAAQYGEWFYYDGKRLQLGRPAGTELPFESDGVRGSLSLSLSLRHSAFEVSQYHLDKHQTLRAASASQSVAWVGQNPLASFALSESERLFPQAMQLPAAQAIDGQPAIDQVAARYKSQHATSLVSSNGWGENPAVQLGSVLNVTGEGLGTEATGEESFGKYLVTSLVHTVDSSGMYGHLFEAVPSLADHPPLGPHRKAPAGQPELAEVIDQEDPLHLGRVRVRYYWGVAKPTEAESDWLRVSTPYSGDGKGQLFTPEKGSQVLVGYENNRAEQPLILGNLFHPQNKQSAKYSTPENHLKGLQTAGGNKVVMSDKKGEQTILLSNSNNKGTAVEVGFKGDGSITIKSNGPVTVLSPNITLEAGDKGSIKLHAKTVTVEAEELLRLSSETKDVEIVAKEKLAYQGREVNGKAQEKMNLDGGTKLTADSADSQYL
jgi:type VI secretion system secreted protein VgrG